MPVMLPVCSLRDERGGWPDNVFFVPPGAKGTGFAVAAYSAASAT